MQPLSVRQILENQLRRDWSWPSPDAGWTWWVFASRDDTPPWPVLDVNECVNALRAEQHFDYASVLAASGFAAAILSIPPDVQLQWKAGFERLRRRVPFPHDRQAFPFRPVELLGICLGAARLGDGSQKLWLQEILERAQTAAAPFDFWRWTLGALAAAEVNVTWCFDNATSLWSQSQENTALWYWLNAAPLNSVASTLAKFLDSQPIQESLKQFRHAIFAPIPSLEVSNDIPRNALFLFAINRLNQSETSEVSARTIHPMLNHQNENLRGQIDFALISVREDEYEAVLRRFPKQFFYRGAHRTYAVHRLTLSDGRIFSIAAVRTTEQGETAAQQLTRDVIADLDPQYLMVVGIAGGIPANEFTLGDVVAAMRLQDYSVHARLDGGAVEYAVGGGPMMPEVQDLLAALPAMTTELGEWNSPETIGKSRPPLEMNEAHFYGPLDWQKSTREKLIRHWGDGSTERLPKVTTGAVASSDGLIKDAQLVENWKQSSRQLLAVEMELAGIYKGAQTRARNYPIIAIRGISDIVGFQRHHDWTEYACETAASFAQALIKTGMFNCIEKTAPSLTS